MKSILIDPFLRTVTMVDVQSPEEAKFLVGSEQVAVVPLAKNAHMILDPVALEKPGMRFFVFGQSQDPIAGRGVIRGNTEDGLQAVDCGLDHVLVANMVQWPPIAFDGWQTVPKFRPLSDQERDVAPQALPQPTVPPEAQPNSPAKPWSIWTIREDVDRGYTATLVSVDGQGQAKPTGMVLENEDLDELRALLPQDLIKVERTTTDEPSIVESWVSRLKK